MRIALSDWSEDSKRSRLIGRYVPGLLFLAFVGAVAGLFTGLTKRHPDKPYSLSNSDLSDLSVEAVNDLLTVVCAPNGDVAFTDERSNTGWYWDPAQFLSVTLGFGGLSFTAAKGIDVFFDLIIGRGIQLLLSALCYRTIRRGIIRSLEVRGVAIPIAFSLFLNQISMTSLWTLVKSPFKSPLGRTSSNERPGNNESGKSGATFEYDAVDIKGQMRPSAKFDWRLIHVSVVILYILLISTLLSAATSYQAESNPYVKIPTNEAYLPASQMVPADLQITDGDRLGFNQTAYLSKNDTGHDALEDYSQTVSRNLKAIWDNWTSILNDHNGGNRSNQSCDLTDIPFSYSLNCQDPSTCGFIIHPQKMVKDDCTFREPYQYWLTYNYDVVFTGFVDNVTDSHIVLDGVRHNLSQTVLNITFYHSLPVFRIANTTLLWDDVVNNARCEPSKTYQWGFSALALFTICMISIVVGFLVINLHYDAWLNSPADRHRAPINVYRDVLDLAAGLRETFREVQLHKLPPDQLKAAVEECPAKLHLDMGNLGQSRFQQSRGRRHWDVDYLSYI